MTYQEVVLLVVDFMKHSILEEKEYMPVDEELVGEIGKYLNFGDGKYIRVVPVDTSNRLILGKLRHFKKGVDIGINDSALNNCWKRFVITKELSHLIMSKNGEGITNDMRSLVNGLFSMDLGLSDAIDHEDFAIMFAAEYLMPYKISQNLLEDVACDDLQIAKIFGVPEVLVRAYRVKDHLESRDDAYKLAHQEHPTISNNKN